MDFKVDSDFALLYGIMLGDGCLSLVNGRKKFITITGSLRNDLPFFLEIVSPILFKFRGKSTNIKFRRSCGAIDFNFMDCNLFDFIASFGFPIGRKLDHLFIPRIFYEKCLVESVIAGFFATDGSLVLTKNPNKYYPRLEAHVISGVLLKEIFEYLKKIGMNGAFYLSKSIPDKRFNTQRRYRFQFNGKKNLLCFDKKIGFVNPYYKGRFLQFVEYSEIYDKNSKNGKILQSREVINLDFYKKMTLGRFELPVSAS